MTVDEQILKISGCHLEKDKDLTNFTTFRLRSIGDFIEVQNVEACQRLIKLLNQNSKKYIVLGWGANQILPAKCDSYIIHLDFPFNQNYLEQVRDEYIFPASLGLNHLTSHAAKFGLKGWDVFTGIPASIGGAVYMNAGTNLGEIGTLIKKVQIVGVDGNLREEVISQNSFQYRKNNFVRTGEIIVEVTMNHFGIDELIKTKIKDYLEYRKSTQPLASKNCGCVFKNPYKNIQAGRLIDLLGLKELQFGNLKVSPKHANFMENSGGANWDQFKAIVDTIQFEMNLFYGIEFELEVKIPYH